MVARLECAPRAGPSERRRTNRWTGARIASFSTNFVRPHLLGVAAPGQLTRSASSWRPNENETLNRVAPTSDLRRVRQPSAKLQTLQTTVGQGNQSHRNGENGLSEQ